MNKEQKEALLQEIWSRRNPFHEPNASTGKDMFWGTLLMVIEDFNAARVEEEAAPRWEVEKSNCTLPDSDLLAKIEWWVHNLAETGGEAWTLRAPVDFNYDPDMLIIELTNRYRCLAGYAAALDPERRMRMPHLRDLINAYLGEQISISKFLEEINNHFLTPQTHKK